MAINFNNLQHVLTLPAPRHHIVQVCENEISQADILTDFIKDGLLKGEAVIVIVNIVLRKTIISKLSLAGLHLQNFKDNSQIKFLDTDFLISSLFIDGAIEKQTFHKLCALPLYEAQLKFRKARAFGDLVDVLWKNGQQVAALMLEEMFNNLYNREKVAILCIYLLNSLDSNNLEGALERICKYHTHSIPIIPSHSLLDRTILREFVSAWVNVCNKLTKFHSNKSTNKVDIIDLT
ncbi:MEDS domain-containing protein [Nitrosomonas supralitoralis]|uniref:MEDS domain-containing protein n=1 Tax=Nitrosomonas supralitoralis TaxID=2116706 RepID=A0A2P7NRE4_9PROT|nr:MEDS domain-containing protein [Nitrosomonas supralitoralis]PSJ16056.1 hypothetical protein C7H79_15595 [Nitrosomonas supralitoralis]